MSELSTAEQELIETPEDATVVEQTEVEAAPAQEANGQLLLPEKGIQMKGKMSVVEHDICEAYKSVQARLKAVGEHATFFKKFADYVAQLDPGPEGDVVAQNLQTAVIHCAALSKDLEHAIKQLRKVDELEETLNSLVAERDGAPPPQGLPEFHFVPEGAEGATAAAEEDDTDEQI